MFACKPNLEANDVCRLLHSRWPALHTVEPCILAICQLGPSQADARAENQENQVTNHVTNLVSYMTSGQAFRPEGMQSNIANGECAAAASSNIIPCEQHMIISTVTKPALPACSICAGLGIIIIGLIRSSGAQNLPDHFAARYCFEVLVSLTIRGGTLPSGYRWSKCM